MNDMKITPKFDFVSGSFDTDNIRLLCVPSRENGKVKLCIETDESNFNFAIGEIKLYSGDLYVDFIETLEEATKFGDEICRRYNQFTRWKSIEKDGYPEYDPEESKMFIVRYKDKSFLEEEKYFFHIDNLYKRNKFYGEIIDDIEVSHYMEIPSFDQIIEDNKDVLKRLKDK